MEMNLGLSERVAKLRDRVSEIIQNEIIWFYDIGIGNIVIYRRVQIKIIDSS